MNAGLLLIAMAICVQSPIPKVNSKGIDLRCGEYCLAVSLRALEIASPGVVELETKLGQPGPMGFSMKQLAEVAEQYGAYTLGMDTSLDHLERRRGRFACIALDENRGHFFCISDIDSKSVHLVDPPERRVVSRDAFGRLWKGRAMLISNRPIDPSVPGRLPTWAVIIGWLSVAALILVGLRLVINRRTHNRTTVLLILLVFCGVFTGLACGESSPGVSAPLSSPIRNGIPLVTIEPKQVDLGMMDSRKGSSLHGEFSISNQGTAPLHLFNGDVSCGCTVIDPIPEVIASGKSVAIKLKVKPKNLTGEQGSAVILRTDDPVSPSIRVPIRWSERAALTVEPKVVDFGWVPSGMMAEKSIEVINVAALGVETFDVKLSGSAVSTSWVTDALRAGADGIITRYLKIKLESARDPGDGTTTLVILDHGSNYLVNLPISWKSGPPVALTPKAFFHSRVRPRSTVTNQILVHAMNGGNVRVIGTEVDGKRTLISDQPGHDAYLRSQTIQIQVIAGDSPGIERHKLRIFLEGMEDEPLMVPVTLVIE